MRSILLVSVHPIVRLFVSEGVFLWRIDHVQSKINIKVGPIKVILGLSFNMSDLPNGSICKPRELVIRHVMFVPVHVQPEASGVDMSNFNYRGVRAKRF